ncbi:hypothetical protein MA16_Dca023308 [Dendrobium catenatum]|uniref:Uncharacterized protein n=1 Tax=Dendrobium catenatum TaxID=906689 RepID=A0A2I0WE14_9ASPA|nr:hypothetical protein MA16_Dca023308 [Dendrobium catenatum]
MRLQPVQQRGRQSVGLFGRLNTYKFWPGQSKSNFFRVLRTAFLKSHSPFSIPRSVACIVFIALSSSSYSTFKRSLSSHFAAFLQVASSALHSLQSRSPALSTRCLRHSSRWWSEKLWASGGGLAEFLASGDGLAEFLALGGGPTKLHEMVEEASVISNLSLFSLGLGGPFSR